MEIAVIAGIVIFVGIFIIISTEVVNKTVAALVGAALFLGLKLSTNSQAMEAIDWEVIFLLVSMMILVGITKTTGLFQWIAIRIAKLAKGEPMVILILLSLATGLLSAFLDNVTTILILTPITILIAVELGITPITFIVSLAIASNIGGTATLIGDPPNVMIGTRAHFGFLDFITTLGPLILVLLVVLCFVLWLFFHKKMVVSNERKARIMEFNESQSIENVSMLIKSMVVLSLVILGFLFHGLIGLEPSAIALIGAALLLFLTYKKEIHHYLNEVEWETIFFFIGLFMMVGGLEALGVISTLSNFMLGLTEGNIENTSYLILWFSGLFSALVDNIPYVATMIPLISDMGKTLGELVINPLWWSLAIGACLGGNGTLIGASANVVAVGLAKKSGYNISFWDFTKYGLIITVINLTISTLYVNLYILPH